MRSVMRLSIIIMITGAVPFDSVAAEKTLLSQNAPPAASSSLPNPTIAPSVAEIRQSVVKSLPFLEREGLAWMRGKACVTCHQIPAMVWSLGEARRHGYGVDAAKLALWNTWSLDNGWKRGVYYKLTEDSIQKLQESGLPIVDAEKLKPLVGKNHVFAAEFTTALSQALGEPAFSKCQAAAVAAAAKAGQGGGGGASNSQYTALLLAGSADTATDPAAVRRELVAGLVKSQKSDGSWEAAGQFLGQQRPKPETLEVVALWTLLALAAVPESSAEKTAAEALGRRFVIGSKETNNTETLMLRAMLAAHDGNAELSRALRKRLIAAQHDDGGWGWLLDRPRSDAFTTGMVLYGLAYLGDVGKEPAVARAQRYLFQQQRNDGVWSLVGKTISANTREDTKQSDAIYTYWTTGWAVLGLLKTMPE